MNFTCPKCEYQSYETQIMKSHLLECDKIQKYFGQFGLYVETEDIVDNADIAKNSELEMMEIEFKSEAKSGEQFERKGEVIESNDSRNQAIIEQKNSNGHTFDCQKCPDKFDNIKQLTTHCLEDHLSMKFMCKLCKHRFETEENLIIHSKQHKNGTYKEANACHICSQTFNNKSNLTKHLLNVHLKMRYFCDICGKSYSSMTTLIPHKKQEHKLSNNSRKKLVMQKAKVPKMTGFDSKYSKNTSKLLCQLCELKLANKTELNNHYLEDHLKVKFECNRCERSYERFTELREHLKDQHSLCGEEPISCNFCDRAFAHSKYLQAHYINTHLKIKEHCEICGKAFVGPCVFIRHLKVIHNQTIYQYRKEHDF